MKSGYVSETLLYISVLPKLMFDQISKGCRTFLHKTFYLNFFSRHTIIRILNKIIFYIAISIFNDIDIFFVVDLLVYMVQ